MSLLAQYLLGSGDGRGGGGGGGRRGRKSISPERARYQGREGGQTDSTLGSNSGNQSEFYPLRNGLQWPYF